MKTNPVVIGAVAGGLLPGSCLHALLTQCFLNESSRFMKSF